MSGSPACGEQLRLANFLEIRSHALYKNEGQSDVHMRALPSLTEAFVVSKYAKIRGNNSLQVDAERCRLANIPGPDVYCLMASVRRNFPSLRIYSIKARVSAAQRPPHLAPPSSLTSHRPSRFASSRPPQDPQDYRSHAMSSSDESILVCIVCDIVLDDDL